MPTVDYFLCTSAQPVDASQPLWHRHLPQSRQGRANAVRSGPGTADAITYGRYFTAIHRFCAADGWIRMVRAVSRRLGQPIGANDLQRVSIYLEKHGALYHPARLQVMAGGHPLSFVVNVAASDAGRQPLPIEVRALERLNDQRPFGWLPAVYDWDATDLPLFLGEWFEGFHEFHLTRPPDREETTVVVWDQAPTPTLLSADQRADLCRQAAMILTACYDPVSSHQIHPWHHAAGDFLVRVDKPRLAVRLITVRGYAPLAMAADGGPPEDHRALLDALAAFFIQLTIRMRLDRLDGVADVAWAPPDCLAPTVKGFFQGLDLTARLSGFPERFPETFRCYFNQIDLADLTATARRITEGLFRPRSEEQAVTQRHLTGHLVSLCRIMRRRACAESMPG